MKIRDLITMLERIEGESGNVTLAYGIAFRDDFEWSTDTKFTDEQWDAIAYNFNTWTTFAEGDIRASVQEVLERNNEEV